MTKADMRKGVGERIMLARMTAGMTQRVLASKLKTSQAVVSQWERGENMPAAARVPNLAKVLKVTPGWLLTGENAGTARGSP